MQEQPPGCVEGVPLAWQIPPEHVPEGQFTTGLHSRQLSPSRLPQTMKPLPLHWSCPHDEHSFEQAAGWVVVVLLLVVVLLVVALPATTVSLFLTQLLFSSDSATALLISAQISNSCTPTAAVHILDQVSNSYPLTAKEPVEVTCWIFHDPSEPMSSLKRVVDEPAAAPAFFTMPEKVILLPATGFSGSVARGSIVKSGLNIVVTVVTVVGVVVVESITQ